MLLSNATYKKVLEERTSGNQGSEGYSSNSIVVVKEQGSEGYSSNSIVVVKEQSVSTRYSAE